MFCARCCRHDICVICNFQLRIISSHHFFAVNTSYILFLLLTFLDVQCGTIAWLPDRTQVLKFWLPDRNFACPGTSDRRFCEPCYAKQHYRKTKRRRKPMKHCLLFRVKSRFYSNMAQTLLNFSVNKWFWCLKFWKSVQENVVDNYIFSKF